MPSMIVSNIGPFIDGLFGACGLSWEAERERCGFAVHPGGPKIIEAARDALGLREDQIAWSREVLLQHGNMSSATLPHVWKLIAEDPSVPSGAIVPSVAFGPGLTVSGAVFRKI
jgi:predicted naringenin-chalcone synthase